MQTCSNCNTRVHDQIILCPSCGADLRVFSTTAVALRHFQDNPRITTVTLSVAADACPCCQQMQGSYPKDQVPALPHEGCSHENGCRCFYEPNLTEIYP